MGEEKISPFKIFYNWLFDSDMKKEIPKELLLYNSPITLQYCIKIFILNDKLNSFLDKYFNKINLYYLSKEDLFKFLKQCVKDFKIKRNSIPFIPYHKNEKIFEILQKKIPSLKSYDIKLLIDMINKSEKKDAIYTSLGLIKTEKLKKIKKSKQKIKTKKTIKDFIQEKFQMAKTI